MVGALEHRHVDADVMEDLTPFERDIAAAGDHHAVGESPALENRLARLVVDLS
jgi:hypothetical protein